MFNRTVFGDRGQADEKQKQHYQRYEYKRVIHNSSVCVNSVGINARAWFSMFDGGLYKAREEIRPESRGPRLSFPCLIISFSGLDKNTCYDKSYADYAKNYPDNSGEFFKEIAGQADSENGLSQIRNELSNKFPAGLVYNYHQFTFSIVNKTCQGEIISWRAVE